VDYAYDATYAESSFAISAKTLKQGGTLVILGETPAATSAAATTVAEKKGKLAKADLARYSSLEDIQRLLGGLREAVTLIEQGKLVPTTKTVTLEELPETLIVAKKGATQAGKLVLDVASAK